jgi:hypothetical protein
MTEWQPPSNGKQVDAHHGFNRQGYPVGHATCLLKQGQAGGAEIALEALGDPDPQDRAHR